MSVILQKLAYLDERVRDEEEVMPKHKPAPATIERLEELRERLTKRDGKPVYKVASGEEIRELRSALVELLDLVGEIDDRLTAKETEGDASK